MVQAGGPVARGVLRQRVRVRGVPERREGRVRRRGGLRTGQLIEQGEPVGFCDLTQATVGAQIGGQSYSQIIFFEYEEAIDHFKTGNFAFAAQASAVAVRAGASADADYDRGVAVFTGSQGGLMAEASIGGQKFRFVPD